MPTPPVGNSQREDSAINAMENWAALVEKEAHTAKIWSMNWGEVFYPGGQPTIEEQIATLETKAAELDKVIELRGAAGKNNKLETFLSPHLIKKTGLKAAFPFGG